MKRKIMTMVLSLAMLAGVAQELATIASYNVRVLNANDEAQGDVWSRRCKAICDQMNFVSPVAFGTQEVTYKQLQDMQQLLDRYAYIGVGRDDGKQAGEFMAIFYNKEQLELLKHDTFWLSETPEKVSRGWDGACNRVCTWGEFKDKRTKKKFYYFNTHLDHKGPVAQVEGAKLLLRKIREIAKGAPAVLSHLLNGLYALDKLRKAEPLAKAAFELRLLCLAGYEPLADSCAYCGCPDPERPMLDVVQGVLRCGTCGVQERALSMPLCPGSLAALRHIVYGDPKHLYSFTLGDDALRRLSAAAEAFVAAQLERGFRSLDFYKSLQPVK